MREEWRRMVDGHAMQSGPLSDTKKLLCQKTGSETRKEYLRCCFDATEEMNRERQS